MCAVCESDRVKMVAEKYKAENKIVNIALIGAGDSACEESNYLAGLAENIKVH